MNFITHKIAAFENAV